MIALAHQADDLQLTAVLRMLRRAGRRGVPYIAIRDQLNGDNPNRVLDELRALGWTIQRTSSANGILAVLVNDGRAA